MPVWGEWRRPAGERPWAAAAAVVCYVLLLGWVLDMLSPVDTWARRALVLGVGVAYLGVAGLLAYRVLVHARVTAGPSGLDIANPFRGDQHVGWDEIASMRADRLLLIYERSGARRIAWAIQKNGWDRAHHHRTDADEAVAELGRLAGRALGTEPRNFADHPS